MLHKFVFEHIKDEDLVPQKSTTNFEAFALNLIDMHEDLGIVELNIYGLLCLMGTNLFSTIVERKIIPPNCNPVDTRERIARPSKDITGRPTKRRMETVYNYNEEVPRVDWRSPYMSIGSLLAHTEPFHPSLFISPALAAEEDVPHPAPPSSRGGSPGPSSSSSSRRRPRNPVSSSAAGTTAMEL